MKKKRKRRSPEQIVKKLRDAEVMLTSRYAALGRDVGVVVAGR